MSSMAFRSFSGCSKNILTRTSSSATFRTFSAVPRCALRPAMWNITASRSFSVTASVRAGSGANDLRLSQKLQEEIQYEKENASKEQEPPEFLAAFLSEKVWKIETTPGSDEIALTRTFGKELIKVMFTIADLDSVSDEDFIPQENEEGNDNDNEADEDEVPPAQPLRVSITITKDGSEGSLSLDATCHDGVFVAENVAYYSDAKLAAELTAEADWKRRGLYMGPQFDHLDIGVQDGFESYLRERGISEGLALFIPEYAEYKEQKEYVRWLQNVKNFIEA